MRQLALASDLPYAIRVSNNKIDRCVVHIVKHKRAFGVTNARFCPKRLCVPESL